MSSKTQYETVNNGNSHEKLICDFPKYSQFCLKITIGKVQNLLLYKNEKRVAQKIKTTNNNKKSKTINLKQREVIFNFGQ